MLTSTRLHSWRVSASKFQGGRLAVARYLESRVGARAGTGKMVDFVAGWLPVCYSAVVIAPLYEARQG